MGRGAASHPVREARVSCDSLVALGVATADGVTLFAKNSDRPAGESQPLIQLPRQQHPAGARVGCQYLEIDQVGETARLIGSRPFWLWGFEHGLNEHGVAIGNHTVFARDGLGSTGLTGMDLVRLGLERGRSARQAVETITALVERHGQGGSGYFDKDWPYHNSFLLADAREAYLLETSNRTWAVRHVDDVCSASNHVSITDDWDGLAPETIEHAVENGWWSEASEARFDFAAAYRDTSLPEVISSGRHRRTCALLEGGKGTLSAGDLRRALRDHYDGGTTFVPGRAPDDERCYSVCMHADPVGTTTASMIARLPAGAAEVQTYWASLGSPCLGIFLPLYVQAEIPLELSRGGEHASGDSPWWRFKALLSRVEQDWSQAPRIRAAWDEVERSLETERSQVEARAGELLRRDDAAAARRELTAFSQRSVDAALAKLDALLA